MQRFWKILVGLFASLIGLGCEGIATAAYYKSADAGVIRAGMSGDFATLAVIAGVLGLVFLSLAIWSLWPRKTRKPDPVSQF